MSVFAVAERRPSSQPSSPRSPRPLVDKPSSTPSYVSVFGRHATASTSGVVDEVRTYDRALAAPEVAALP